METLKCIAQEPAFTPLDRQFITGLGFEVVEDPAAFGHITDGTLVYAIHCYSDIFENVSKGPQPAAMVGNTGDAV